MAPLLTMPAVLLKWPSFQNQFEMSLIRLMPLEIPLKLSPKAMLLALPDWPPSFFLHRTLKKLQMPVKVWLLAFKIQWLSLVSSSEDSCLTISPLSVWKLWAKLLARLLKKFEDNSEKLRALWKAQLSLITPKV